MQELEKFPTLDVPPTSPKRRILQPAFKMTYETADDIRLRLLSTFIWVGKDLYYVSDVWAGGNEVWLILSDDKKAQWKVPYRASNCIDLRSPDPQYINVESRPGFFGKFPVRQQQQGVNYHNSFFKEVGSPTYYRTDLRAPELIQALRHTDTLPWSDYGYKLLMEYRAMRALRLSSNLAFYRKEDQLWAEYKGRPLGLVTENEISVSALDAKRPWIAQDASDIGCILKQVEDVRTEEATSVDD